jgi:hypothetical protein
VTSASIDDLLGHEEEPPPRRRRPRSAPERLLRALLVAAACTAAVVYGLRLFSVGIAVPAVFAGVLALLGLRRATAQVRPTPPRPAHVTPDRTVDDGTYDFDAAEDVLRDSVNNWERRLVRSKGESGRFARELLPMIGELADERLRLRHGLTRASDPDRARVLLGEDLWMFLTTATKRTPAPRDLAAVIGRLEKL